MTNKQRLWFSEWPTTNGFYWLRGWRHYGDLPISVDGESFWMMFALAKHHRTDLDDSEDVQFLGPITPYSAVTAAALMRSACIEKVTALRDRNYTSEYAMYWLRKAIEEIEATTIQEQEKQTNSTTSR